MAARCAHGRAPARGGALVSARPARCVAPLSLDEIDITTDSPRARDAMRVLSRAEIEVYRGQGADPADCDRAAEGEAGHLTAVERVEAMLALRPVLCGRDATTERTVEGLAMPLCEEHAAELDRETAEGEG